MQKQGEKGQAVLLMLVAMGLFLFGAVGLAIDGSHLYAQRQMAQTAADAAAQAGIMSMFNATNTGVNAFGTPPASSFTCASGDARTPCVYAFNNGFGGGSDTVTVDFPASVTGVNLSTATDPVTAIQVTVTRDVNTTLLRFLGSTMTTIKAVATAGIVDMVAPVPVVVTHPSIASAFSSNGGSSIRICGGPHQSIQVNSTSGSAFSTDSSTTIDLSKAGPNDPGNCTAGTGGNFGSFGGPAAPSFTFVSGTTGRFIQPSSPVRDPLASVVQPSRPGPAPAPVRVTRGANGCPTFRCELYSPGLYSTGIDVNRQTALFKPGLYYMSGGGFANGSNGEMLMASGFPNDPNTGQGMVVFNTGGGKFDVGSSSSATLVGAPLNSIYKGILFFEDRNASSATHILGGNGSVNLAGTVYLTNDLATMTGNPGQYQTLEIHGSRGSPVTIAGQVIASAVSLAGGSAVTIDLNPNATLHVRQVALVK